MDGKADKWADAKSELLLALYEHEFMHEGQLMRHMCGLEYYVPASVKWS
ncbi:MAG: hypothetical protein ACI9UN_004088 [Granulosicoccus sp.]|jgi:hypothetical protein